MAVGLGQVPIQAFTRRLSRWGVRLIMHLHPMPRLRINEPIPLLPQPVFIAVMGTLFLPH
jgi:hypothetical protein